MNIVCREDCPISIKIFSTVLLFASIAISGGSSKAQMIAPNSLCQNDLVIELKNGKRGDREDVYVARVNGQIEKTNTAISALENFTDDTAASEQLEMLHARRTTLLALLNPATRSKVFKDLYEEFANLRQSVKKLERLPKDAEQNEILTEARNKLSAFFRKFQSIPRFPTEVVSNFTSLTPNLLCQRLPSEAHPLPR